MSATKIQIYESTGSSVRQQAAQHSDGTWFSRLQDKGPYGYRWSAWRRMSTAPKIGYEYDSDWGQASAGWRDGDLKAVRLPKGE